MIPRLAAAQLSGWTAQLNALKKFGIKPLVLLNCNLGGMCPFTPLTLTTTAGFGYRGNYHHGI